MDRIDEFIKYHVDSSRAMDIDIQVEAVDALVHRFNLDREGRIWLSFLFSLTYCMATAWYLFKAFPRYDAGTEQDIENWWRRERDGLIFQTDRAWIKRLNCFTEVIASYRNFVRRHGAGSQYEAFMRARDGMTREEAFAHLRDNAGIAHFGRFVWFLFSELLFRAGIPVMPRADLTDAESARNGLVFAMGLETSSYTGRHGRAITAVEAQVLQAGLDAIMERVSRLDILERHKSIWSVETTLCAYKKWKLGKRWVGYYIERGIREVDKMRGAHPAFDWTPLIDFNMEWYPEQTARILEG